MKMVTSRLDNLHKILLAALFLIALIIISKTSTREDLIFYKEDDYVLRFSQKTGEVCYFLLSKNQGVLILLNLKKIEPCINGQH